MRYLKKVEIAASVAKHRSYLNRVEAKYTIMETIKKVATKVLKAALPTLIAFSATTGFAKIKDPEGLGKKFQEIASDSIGNVNVKTHAIQNEEDEPQIIVYTVQNSSSGTGNWGSVTIKYTEGKGAKIATMDASDSITEFAKSVVDTLNTIDEHGKKMAKEHKAKPQKTKEKDTKFAWDR
jgi:hypothetical protein